MHPRNQGKIHNLSLTLLTRTHSLTSSQLTQQVHRTDLSKPGQDPLTTPVTQSKSHTIPSIIPICTPEWLKQNVLPKIVSPQFIHHLGCLNPIQNFPNKCSLWHRLNYTWKLFLIFHRCQSFQNSRFCKLITDDTPTSLMLHIKGHGRQGTPVTITVAGSGTYHGGVAIYSSVHINCV